MEKFWQDFRHAARRLAKQPRFAAVAVITLAIGIGFNTAIFSVVNSILLIPLPYAEPSHLVQISETIQGNTPSSRAASPNNFLDWQQAQSFESLSAINLWMFSVTDTSEPTEISGMKVSANFFSLLGVTPLMGRTFAPEDQADESRVVVISHNFWQNQFGGKEDVIGRPLTLDDESHIIIGVLRPDYRHPMLVVGGGAELWTPLRLNPSADDRGRRYLRVLGRLRSGVAIEQAQAEMTTIAHQIEQAHPDVNTGGGISVIALRESLTGNVRWALLVLQFATGFVLLIACANVANLLLARVAEREREVAIRSALGAGRWHLIRMLLSESLLLSALGGAAGILFALWGVDLLVSIAPQDIPRLDEIALDRRAWVFAFGLSIAAIFIFGLAPAWQSSKVNINEALKEGARGSGRKQGLRSVLVIAEIAMTLVLLVGSGLMLRTLVKLQSTELGFNPENLLTMRISLPSRYKDRQQINNFYQQVLADLETLPGVQSASTTLSLPMFRVNNQYAEFEIEGQPTQPGHIPRAGYRVVSKKYFNTMRIPLIRGREFAERDSNESGLVAIINESLAKHYFADVEPVGKNLVVNNRKREIIGVVGDIKNSSLDADTVEEIYIPHELTTWATVMVIVRTTTDPNGVKTAAQKAIWGREKDAAISLVATMNQVLADQLSRPRFNLLLLGIFSIAALVLTSVGIYGVMSYTVTQNTREIGIRLALGAQQTDVLGLIVGQGLVLTLMGIAFGLAGAFGLTRLMASLLFGVTATDPLTFAGISILLGFVSLIACYIPARRATRVDPLVALRYE